MRGAIPGLGNPHPLGRALPAVYQDEDRFTMRLTEAFDEALAPVISTLDNLPAYFDPHLAPEDFVTWLSGWVAFELDDTWDLSMRREAVARAVDLLRRRGTVSGLADEIELVTGGDVDIVENGGTAWSLDPGSDMVGSARPALLVRVRVADPAKVDVERLDRIVRAAKPAHVPHKVEVLPAEPSGKGKRKGPEPDAPKGGSGGAGAGGSSAKPAGESKATAGESKATAAKPPGDARSAAAKPPAKPATPKSNGGGKGSTPAGSGEAEPAEDGGEAPDA